MIGRFCFFFTILVILFNLSFVLAQEVGVKLGLSVSDIVFSDEGQTPYLGYEINSLEHRKPLLTYQVGIYASFRISDQFNFQPELLYVTQGLDYSTKYLYDDVKYKIKTSYLQLPLLFKYKTAVKKDKYSGILLGPYAALKLDARRITRIEGVTDKMDMSNVKNSDFGLIGGYAFDFNMLSRKMLIDFRASYSLINMMDKIEGNLPLYLGSNKDYARNISIALTVQYNLIESGTKTAKPDEE
jgi:hypothetical protein